MLAFRVIINGKEVCIAGTEGATSLSAIAHGARLPEVEQAVSLMVDGTIEPSVTGSWLNQSLSAGDTVQIEVVDVPASEISAPARTTTFSPDVVAQQEEAYYQRMKAEREPSLQ